MQRVQLIVVLLLVLGANVLAAPSIDKTVFITGANRGIGLGFVKHYLAAEWKVIASARRPDQADDLIALQKDYPGLSIVQLDVTDHARVDALATELKDQPIDVLINNAGIKPLNRGTGVEFDDARKIFEVNVWGAVKVAQALMPNLVASKDRKLINISSWLGSIEQAPQSATMVNYRASKTALNSYMVALSHESVKSGVSITMIHPGGVDVSKGAACAELDENGVARGRLCVAQSISMMMQTIDSITLADNGKFFNYVPRQELPW